MVMLILLSFCSKGRKLMLINRRTVFLKNNWKSGSSIDIQTVPLLEACRNNHIEVVRLLLSHPAIDVNKFSYDLESDYGITPLIETCYRGYVDIFNLLLNAEGIDVNLHAIVNLCVIREILNKEENAFLFYQLWKIKTRKLWQFFWKEKTS